MTAVGPAEGAMETLDGLSLFYADYDAAPPGRAPAICLPGLTRCHRDFAPLAERLAETRRVICPDMRGRGRSAHDQNWENYNLVTETGDVLRLMDRLGVARAAVIGTSRGGLQAILVGLLRPDALLAAVLNDVGPRIEKGGLLRVVANLAATPERFGSWVDCVAAVRRANERQFPALSDAEWDAFARRLFAEDAAGPRRDFDPRLARATEAALEGEIPELWTQFEALRETPMLVIRGALSDVLSPDTVARMETLHPDLDALTLPDRGHAPFLDEPEAVAAIERLLEKADARLAAPPPGRGAAPEPPAARPD